MTNNEKIERLRQEYTGRLKQLHQQEDYGNMKRKEEIRREMDKRIAEERAR